MPDDNPRVISTAVADPAGIHPHVPPSQSPQPFYPRQNAEGALHESVAEIPYLATISMAREMLRRQIVEIGTGKKPGGVTEPWPDDDIAKYPSYQANQLAILNLAGIASRAAGSGVALISSGYVPEAKTSVRRLIEAGLRARSVLDDPTGEHARAWLAGRPLGSAGHLRNRYGQSRCMDGLSTTAHADIEGLRPLSTKIGTKHFVNFSPQRDDEVAGLMFRMMALEILMMNGFLLCAFEGFFPSAATFVETMKVRIALGLKLPFAGVLPDRPEEWLKLWFVRLEQDEPSPS